MTKRQTFKLLRKIKHKNLTRFELRNFCKRKTEFECDREIDYLCDRMLIRISSNPNFEQELFIPDPGDLFEIADSGIDYLSDRKLDAIRTYLPMVISIIALIVSILK